MKKINTLKTLRFVLSQAKPHRGKMIVVWLIMLLYVSADFVYPFAYKRIINLISENSTNPMNAFSAIITAVLILAGALIIHRVCRETAGFFLIRIEIKTMARIAKLAFNYVTKLPYKFHTSTFAGSNAKKINRGVQSLEPFFDGLFYDLTPIILTMIIAIIILLKTHLLIGLPLAIGLMLYIVISMLLVKKRMQLDRLRNQQENKVSGTMIDSFTNNLTVKTFTGEKEENRLFSQQTNFWSKCAIGAWDFEVLTSFFQGGFIAFLEITLLSLSLWLWTKGTFKVGDIVFVQGNMGLLMFPMWTLGRFYRHFRRAEVDLQDLILLLDKPITIKSKKNANKLDIKKGEVKFEQVSFAYEKNYPEALKNITLHIQAGEKIALVGPSGAGKSTFVKLLFRFIDPLTGKILIDNQDIKKINLESLRQNISLVQQEPLLFHRSIYDNIAYGLRNASKKAIVHSAQLAHAHEFIQHLPKGYQTLVGERGIKLSGGERQRIALARVFLENAKILVLDEATSSLDSVSENLIQKALDNLMQNRTTIVIAHRLSTIRKMDRIIVFEKGRIIEQGPHEELLTTNSLYKKLWESQAGKFLA